MKYFKIHVNGHIRKDRDEYSIYMKGDIETKAEAILYAADDLLYETQMIYSL